MVVFFSYFILFLEMRLEFQWARRQVVPLVLFKYKVFALYSLQHLSVCRFYYYMILLLVVSISRTI